MASYELKHLLTNDFVIYPSNELITILVATTTIATFRLMSTGGDYIFKNTLYVDYLGGHNGLLFPVTKYRIRPRFDEATIDGIPIGYDYLTYEIEYHTTIGSGDPGYTTRYFKMGAIGLKPDTLKFFENKKLRLTSSNNQKLSVIPRQMKTIDLNNSGTFKINNQTMSLK